MKTVRSMAELATLAGVSTSTVSRALSEHPSIPQATRAKILELAQKHDYRINTRAQSLRLQRSNTVAVVFPQGEGSRRLMSDPFYLEIMGAISDELSLHGYDLLVSLTKDDDWQRYVLDKRVDGLLILERDTKELAVKSLHAAKIPFVVWGPILPKQAYLSVGGDSYMGAKTAVEHLISTGRKMIGFIGGDKSMIETSLRFKGYKKALRTADCEVDKRIVAFTDYTPQQAKAAVERMLTQAPHLDALFFCSDFMAVAAFDSLRQAGKRIPDDIAVIGYDDIPLAAHWHPSLTTVRQEVYAGGRLMVKKLLSLFSGETVTSEMLPVELKLRDSCP